MTAEGKIISYEDFNRANDNGIDADGAPTLAQILERIIALTDKHVELSDKQVQLTNQFSTKQAELTNEQADIADKIKTLKLQLHAKLEQQDKGSATGDGDKSAKNGQTVDEKEKPMAEKAKPEPEDVTKGAKAKLTDDPKLQEIFNQLVEEVKVQHSPDPVHDVLVQQQQEDSPKSPVNDNNERAQPPIPHIPLELPSFISRQEGSVVSSTHPPLNEITDEERSKGQSQEEEEEEMVVESKQQQEELKDSQTPVKTQSSLSIGIASPSPSSNTTTNAAAAISSASIQSNLASQTSTGTVQLDPSTEPNILKMRLGMRHLVKAYQLESVEKVVNDFRWTLRVQFDRSKTKETADKIGLILHCKGPTAEQETVRVKEPCFYIDNCMGGLGLKRRISSFLCEPPYNISRAAWINMGTKQELIEQGLITAEEPHFITVSVELDFHSPASMLGTP